MPHQAAYRSVNATPMTPSSPTISTSTTSATATCSRSRRRSPRYVFFSSGIRVLCPCTPSDPRRHRNVDQHQGRVVPRPIKSDGERSPSVSSPICFVQAAATGCHRQNQRTHIIGSRTPRRRQERPFARKGTIFFAEYSRCFPHSPLQRKWPEEKLPVGIDTIRNFNVRAKVVGPGVCPS